MNEKQKFNSAVIAGVVVAILAIVGFSLFGIFVLGPDKGPNGGYHIGDTISYDGIQIVVNSVSEEKYSGKLDGYKLTVKFSMKNTTKEDFDFSLDDIYIKTESTESKYERSATWDNFWDNQTLIPGGKYDFEVVYKVPYSLSDENYIMFFDLRYLHSISQCKLYER